MEPEEISDNLPSVLILNTHMYAFFRTTSHTYEIEEGGLTIEELTDFSTQLGVPSAWLAAQLNRPQFGGAAGPVVANMAQFINGARDGPVVVETRRIVPVDSVAEDETCVVCLQEKQDDPTLPWAIAAGCTRHKFHRKCLEQWQGDTCITCRAELDRV